MLIPTTWGGAWFEFGKVLFAVGDLGAGLLMVLVLRDGQGRERRKGGKGDGGAERGMSEERALKFASIWLLNPMVATISTRGSSEGLLGFMVMALLWAVLKRGVLLAGFLLGLSVHFKIYPFIYAPSIIWWMDDERLGLSRLGDRAMWMERVKHFCNRPRVVLTGVSLLTFGGLNWGMYWLYVLPPTFSIEMGRLMEKQIWLPLSAKHLPPPYHPDRPQAQFLAL